MMREMLEAVADSNRKGRKETRERQEATKAGRAARLKTDLNLLCVGGSTV